MGRGYSFDALRAKILFNEKLHKKRKPRFNSSAFNKAMLYDTFNWYEVNETLQTTLVSIFHLLRIWRRVIYKPFHHKIPKNKKAIPIRLGFTQEGILRSDECLGILR